MPEYDIPLSTVYNEGEGRRIEIQEGGMGGPRVYVTDRTGDTPHDVVPLSDGELEELVHVTIAYLNRDNDGTLGKSATGTSFSEYRTDD